MDVYSTRSRLRCVEVQDVGKIKSASDARGYWVTYSHNKKDPPLVLLVPLNSHRFFLLQQKFSKSRKS